MRRQKKLKKSGIPSIIEMARDAVIKKGISLVIAVVAIAAIYVSVSIYVEKSDYFRLRTVETRNSFLDQRAVTAMNSQILNLYRGFNIFSINLKNVASSIQRSYPDAKEVSVRIVMPDKLSISLKFRRPVAVVRDTKLYPIDDEGFVLPSVDANSLKSLPVIDGISIRYDERKGKKSSSRNLRLALELLKEANSARFMAEYGIDTIDAGEVRNISFYLKNGIQVRIGCENFKERLNTLERTLKDPRLLLDRIQYIDVRFKDVIIGPK